jgi:hypothetical protein
MSLDFESTQAQLRKKIEQQKYHSMLNINVNLLVKDFAFLPLVVPTEWAAAPAPPLRFLCDRMRVREMYGKGVLFQVKSTENFPYKS